MLLYDVLLVYLVFGEGLLKILLFRVKMVMVVCFKNVYWKMCDILCWYWVIFGICYGILMLDGYDVEWLIDEIFDQVFEVIGKVGVQLLQGLVVQFVDVIFDGM